MDTPTATIIAAAIGGGVSIAVSVAALMANYYNNRLNLRHGEVKDLAKVSLELKIKQLNELYGPLLLLIEQNNVLAKKIREGKPPDWRLMYNLPAVLSDPRDGPIAQAILSIDEKIEDLNINKAGLIRGKTPPQSFQDFLGHYQLLKLAMQGQRIDPTSKDVYPTRLGEDVKAAYEEIRTEVTAMLGSYERELKEFLK